MKKGDVLGHEFMGEVVEKGSGVTNLEVGDRVVVPFPISCGSLREAIMSCRNGGVVSVIGVYGGLVDKFPIGALMNRGLTIKSGQCHVQRYLRPLLERIQNGEIDPSFVITHRLQLDDAPKGYDIFKHKEDDCLKVVLKP